MNVKLYLGIIILLNILLVGFFIKESTTSPDHELYQDQVNNIRNGQFTKFWLIPTISALLPFTSTLSLKMVSILAFVGIILMCYLLGKKLKSESFGFAVAALAAFNPLIARESIRGLVDVPVTFFFCLTVYFYLEFREKWDLKSGIFLTISAILTILAKNTGFFIIILLPGFLFLEILGKKFKKEYLWVLPAVLFGVFLNWSKVLSWFSSFSLSYNGLIVYISAFNFLKILVSLGLLFVLCYILAFGYKNNSGFMAMWVFSFLIGILLVHSSIIVARHLLPMVPGLLLCICLFIEDILKRIEQEKLVSFAYTTLFLISFILSIQHMARFSV